MLNGRFIKKLPMVIMILPLEIILPRASRATQIMEVLGQSALIPVTCRNNVVPVTPEFRVLELKKE